MAAKFLKSCGHRPTPLNVLPNLAADWGLESIYAKEETNTLGLRSFKARGAAWAMAKICGRRLNIPDSRLDLDFLKAQLAQLEQQLLFIAATDGNHGAAVAAMAKRLGQKAVIFLPDSASAARLKTIRDCGAECIQTDCNYDATVRQAAEFANEKQGILIQDTAWPGYEEIPLWIMQGYATMALEMNAQLGCRLPTHVLLQAGVGSFAAGMIQAFLNLAASTNTQEPSFITIEPGNAACVFKSIGAGNPQTEQGAMQTIMDGLACGEPSSLAWPVLQNNLAAAICCDDSAAIEGMRIFANPVGSDPPIQAGPSGAPGLGVLKWLMADTNPWQRALAIDKNSKIAVIVTESPPDPEAWRRLVKS